MPLFRGTFFLSVKLTVSVFEICAELKVPFEKTCRIMGTILGKYCKITGIYKKIYVLFRFG